MSCLHIKDLHASVDGEKILKGLSLDTYSGKTHTLMRPNGNRKPTLPVAIMGDPELQVTGGNITLNDQDALATEVDERNKTGPFLGMQYPSEVSGVANSDFLHTVINACRGWPIPLSPFIREMEKTTRNLQIKEDPAHHFLNEGSPGEEEKCSEIVQMKLPKPLIAMLGEIDPGLDVDTLKIAAEAVVAMQREQNMGLTVISHHARFYELLKPTHARVLVDGHIVVSDGNELAGKIDQQDYNWIEQEYDMQAVRKEEKKAGLLGSCGASKDI